MLATGATALGQQCPALSAELGSFPAGGLLLLETEHGTQYCAAIWSDRGPALEENLSLSGVKHFVEEG